MTSSVRVEKEIRPITHLKNLKGRMRSVRRSLCFSEKGVEFGEAFPDMARDGGLSLELL